MEQRKKLIELLSGHHSGNRDVARRIADHLLTNGVVVLPCRCEECEYKDIGFYGDIWCKFHDTGMATDGFCSYAKRKGGE